MYLFTFLFIHLLIYIKNLDFITHLFVYHLFVNLHSQ